MLIFLIISYIFTKPGRVVLAPIQDMNNPWETCQKFSLSYIYAKAENIECLSIILKNLNLDKAYIIGWNNEPYDLILTQTGTLTEFNASENTAKYAFCATNGGGSLIEPNFLLQPKILVKDTSSEKGYKGKNELKVDEDESEFEEKED